MPFRGLKPVVWGKFALVPHREPAPRAACLDCRGGGEVNGLPCHGCGGRGWHDGAHPAPDDAGIY